jgi:hypothetical protein
MKQYNLVGILTMNSLTTGPSYDFPGRTGGTNPKEDAYAVRCKKDKK